MFGEAEQLGAGLISYRPSANEDGYFLLLASPRIEADAAEISNKNVIFVVDRSGSMSMPVAGGKTKMDLANLGTSKCVELLSGSDKIAEGRKFRI